MPTVVLLVLAAPAACADWWAVATHRERARYVSKPLTLALLVAAASVADLGDAKGWVIAALALGLVGDVALLAPAGPVDAPPGPAFLAGLGAFLVGHVAWIVAFLTRDTHRVAFVAGLVAALAVGALALGPVLASARRSAGLPFAAIVAGYAAVLVVAAAFAVGTGLVATAVGGLLFLLSDATLARERFVRPVRGGPLLVIVSYHLAQALMLVGLVHSF